jgi:hypothetical protein
MDLSVHDHLFYVCLLEVEGGAMFKTYIDYQFVCCSVLWILFTSNLRVVPFI